MDADTLHNLAVNSFPDTILDFVQLRCDLADILFGFSV